MVTSLPSPARPDCSEAGFTLLEVLVSLVLLSLIFTGIFGFLSQSRKFEELKKHNAQIIETEFLERYLRNTLRNAQKLPILSEGFLQQRYLTGTNNQMTFVTKSRRGAVGFGLFDVSIHFDRKERTLVEERVLRRFNNNNISPLDDFVIYLDLQRFSIAYGRFEGTRNNLVWQDEWSAERSLPEAVRYSYEIAAKISDKKISRELVILLDQ